MRRFILVPSWWFSQHRCETSKNPLWKLEQQNINHVYRFGANHFCKCQHVPQLPSFMQQRHDQTSMLVSETDTSCNYLALLVQTPQLKTKASVTLIRNEIRELEEPRWSAALELLSMSMLSALGCKTMRQHKWFCANHHWVSNLLSKLVAWMPAFLRCAVLSQLTTWPCDAVTLLRQGCNSWLVQNTFHVENIRNNKYVTNH